MNFWLAIVIIAGSGILSEMIIRLVKIGTKYSENIERIRHGYPTIDGATSHKMDFFSDSEEQVEPSFKSN